MGAITALLRRTRAEDHAYTKCQRWGWRELWTTELGGLPPAYFRSVGGGSRERR
jgi:hypothetical protein